MDLVPKKAITIGIWEIFQSKELCFCLDSSWKGEVFKKTVFDKPNPSFPSTYLKTHRKSSITVSRDVLDNFISEKENNI
jgi:6-phosphogluconolactonase/glucosamine-6-phosphate isomerase/deaminase